MSEPCHRVIDLTALAKALDVNLASERGLTQLRSLLRDLLIRDDIDVPEEDNDLLTAIVYGLDAMEDDAGLRAEAKAFVPLLSREIPRPKALLLVPLIEGRQRLDELLMRFAHGVMTRKASRPT